MDLVRFASMILRISFILALVGCLKTCTLQILGLAAKNTETGIMPYSKLSQALTK